MAQEDIQMKKEPGLKPSESPHLPLETPEQHPTCWRFALLLSPNPNAKPNHSPEPRQMTGCQKGPKQQPAKMMSGLKAFDSPRLSLEASSQPHLIHQSSWSYLTPN